MVVRMMANMHTVLTVTFENIANASPGRMGSVERDGDGQEKDEQPAHRPILADKFQRSLDLKSLATA
ncbi:MAG: hypothetical protein F9K47_13865 [Burkholderiales bacterium]|jgi:hypothetical protein|nr:MAG: hypothetical protein F9K47_13865 [Burkholderiales bacterium]